MVKTNRPLDRKFELIACTMREFLCAVDFSNTGQNFITRPGLQPLYMSLFGNAGLQGKMPCSRGDTIICFEPMKINGLELKNRMVVSAMVTNYCTPDGKATEKFIAYHEHKAKGGWAD